MIVVTCTTELFRKYKNRLLINREPMNKNLLIIITEKKEKILVRKMKIDLNWTLCSLDVPIYKNRVIFVSPNNLEMLISQGVISFLNSKENVCNFL